MLSLSQIELINQNAPSLNLSKYIDRNTFLPFFLTHLQEYFQKRGKILHLSEPLLEGEVQESTVIHIFVDNEFFAQLYYLLDDYTLEVTFFIFNEEFSHKYFLLENEMAEETAFHTYCFWLKALFGIYESYLENRKKECP